MGKVEVELNKKGVGELLKSEDMQKCLEKIAKDHAQGWKTDTKTMQTRVIASIYTTDSGQVAEELNSHRIVGGL